MRDADADLAPDLAYRLDLPRVGRAPTPVVFASPHSGRVYPADMAAARGLSPLAVRRSEDAHVDDLLAEAPAYGFALICATYGRAYLDVNRASNELDPAMFAEPLPRGGKPRTARVAAGLGAIARLAGEGHPIYDRKLTLAEAEARMARVHRPYHRALAGLVDDAVAAHGLSVLIDWHSMPSAAVRTPGGRGPDIVLGDRYGCSCDGALTGSVERRLRGLGFEVARNAPYAGGFTTERYGDPACGVHALQIEVNRALYLDEAEMRPSEGFAALASALDELFASLAAADWSPLRPASQKNRARRRGEEFGEETPKRAAAEAAKEN